MKSGEMWRFKGGIEVGGIYYALIKRIDFHKNNFGPELFEDYWITWEPYGKQIEFVRGMGDLITYPRKVFLECFEFFKD